ncbi:MAG: carboxylesterase family protein, partial [Bryobacteraceae bacterium]
MRFATRTLFAAAIAIGVNGVTNAQVPPEIAKQLVNIGRGVCVLETAKIYRPLHPVPPYPDVQIARDSSFGPDPANLVDIFGPKKGKKNLPVLIYVSGGAGNRQQGGPDGEPFYDNVMLWAAKNDMVGVNMQRRPGRTWDDPAKDIAIALFWLNKNISKVGGNPKRMFIWAQSAGNVPVSTYVGHPEYYGPQGVGLKGAIFMSPPAFNILPATPPPVQGGIAPCGQPNGEPAAAAPAGRGPGGPGRGKGAGKGRGAQPDAATQLARSNLPGLVKSKVKFMVSVAELDPPNIIAFAETLKSELCKAGDCPTYMVYK